MADTIDKNELFPPARSGPQTKAEITHLAVQAIIEAERDAREAKTRKLRQARLAMEARQPKSAPARGRAGKKAKSAASRHAA